MINNNDIKEYKEYVERVQKWFNGQTKGGVLTYMREAPLRNTDDVWIAFDFCETLDDFYDVAYFAPSELGIWTVIVDDEVDDDGQLLVQVMHEWQDEDSDDFNNEETEDYYLDVEMDE